MKANYTHITTLLDRSRSMDAIREATIAGYNNFINSQRGLPGLKK